MNPLNEAIHRKVFVVEDVSLEEAIESDEVQKAKIREMIELRERWANATDIGDKMEEMYRSARKLRGHPVEKQMHIRETFDKLGWSRKKLDALDLTCGGFADVEGFISQSLRAHNARAGGGHLTVYRRKDGKIQDVVANLLKQKPLNKDSVDVDPYGPTALYQSLKAGVLKLGNPAGFAFFVSSMAIGRGDSPDQIELREKLGTIKPSVRQTIDLVAMYAADIGLSCEHVHTTYMTNAHRLDDARISFFIKA
jgi:hypothetical protein